MAAHKKVDYERIEPAWRAGLQSPPQLAAIYTKETGVSVTGTAISKHFKKQGITRDLSAKIRQKADAMVLEAMVSGKVTPETLSRDKTIIEQGATQVATVRLHQRTDIQRARNLAMSLMTELEFATDSRVLLSNLAELMAGDETNTPALMDAYRKVTSMSGRVGNLKQLSDSLKTLVALEREAFGIDAPEVDTSNKPTRVELVAL